MLSSRANVRISVSRPVSWYHRAFARANAARHATKLTRGRTHGFAKQAPPHRSQPAAARSAADVTIETTTTSKAAPDATQPFAWERNWWPVHVVSYLDASRPTPVELLGMQLVLWRDASGTWRCFRDSCPHRRVPLSEGRVEGGELVCSYHGWRFNEGGACTAIPQAPDAKSLAAATASPRSCVTAFPTQVAGGLLWVWPEDSPVATISAAAATPWLPNAFDQPQFEGQMENGWYMRELPYAYDILVENITDPSHLPYAHHKLTSFLNRKTAAGIPFKPIEDHLHADDPDLLPSGPPPVCAFQFPQNVERRVVFNAPGLVTYTSVISGLITVIMAVPAGPGRSKVFTASGFPSKAEGTTLLQQLFRLIIKYQPTWRAHLLMMKLFDGDSVFLNAQGRFLRAAERQAGGEGPAWAKEYFMPMTSDRAVVAARKWIDSVGSGGPAFPADVMPATEQVTRAQLLDRLDQHTKHCPDCQRGQQFASRLVVVGTALLAAAFFALCCLAGTYGFRSLLAGGLPSVGTLAAAVCGALALAMRSAGERLQRQFIFTDYVHADIP